MPDYEKMAHRRGCRHFTGLSNETCKQGIEYRPIMPDLPCITRLDETTYSGTCPLFEFWTAAETEEHERKSIAAALAWSQKLQAHICPECGASTLPERQVGRCVYGACNHRLYQGRLAGSKRK